jgi:DnaK suppressor protein
MLNKRLLNKIKKGLINEKNNILQRSVQSDDIDSDGDEIDEVQAKIELDLQQKCFRLSNNRLNQIEEALERIEQNIYGICVDCDEPIAEKRLLANPHYTTCVSCAEERETEEKRRKGM